MTNNNPPKTNPNPRWDFPTRHVLLVIMLLALTACGGSSDSPDGTTPNKRGALVSVSSDPVVSDLEVAAALALLKATGVDTSTLSGSYNVTLSSIVYKTLTPDGRLINASGMVAYPHRFNNDPSPVLSFQHATIFLDENAPTRSDSMKTTLKALAGSGYIVVMADYIGYGASNNELHTYVQAQGLSTAVVDMLRAARRFLANNNIATSNTLLLTGYSEGGYATLAAQKEMEQNLAAEFQLTASMPAAGPYDMSTSAQYMLGLNTNPSPQYLAFVMASYNHWYNWSRIDTIYQSAYRDIMTTYFDGTHSGSSIEALLPTTTADLYLAGFLADFLGSGELALKADIAKNDIYDWAPTAPTRLFHGTDDAIVPYSNATAAYNAMVAAGANDITLIDCTTPSALIPANHTNCVPDYLSQVIDWFGAIVQGEL